MMTWDKMREDTGKPWLIRRGRNWIEHTGWSERVDGWWMLGYRMWMPDLKYFYYAFMWWITGNGNNYFYTKKRRDIARIEL
jgi:hypothetical protein